MAFELIWAERAKKDLKKIDIKTAARIVTKIELMAQNDKIQLEKVKGKEYYKIRVGKFRIFVERFLYTKRLGIVKIRHRKNAYKN